MKQLVIVGAGGHGRVAADVAKKMGEYDEVFFLDDCTTGTSGGYTIKGRICDARAYVDDSVFFVAVGNNEVRKKIMLSLEKMGSEIATLIHPSAQIGSDVSIEAGTILMAGSVVNNGSKIGKGVIVNTCASVDHDCVIDDFVHISVGAHIAGTVRVGEQTMLGAGATVINNVCICDRCVIGAGAVVVGEISDSGTYVGVPARKIK